MSKSQKTNFLTKEGYEKLVKELHEIREVKLPEVIERIADAKAM
jgi:transcription elongation GreA/GreB family factor